MASMGQLVFLWLFLKAASFIIVLHLSNRLFFVVLLPGCITLRDTGSTLVTALSVISLVIEDR